MATGQLNGVLHHLRRTVLLRDERAHSDAELLSSFIANNEESGFASLICRHGPMVFGVCLRVLGNTHDAEDAFQAAFLVLARKATSIRPRSMVGNWLYGVAYRTALRAKTMIAKRQSREKQVNEMPDREAPAASSWSDLQPLLDQELNALADKYRVPIVLCDLEGMSQREAAKQLGCPEGTLMTRLARARQMLAKRLRSRGLALSAGALAALLVQNAASAAMPMLVATATVKAATLIATGQAATAVSAEVAALTEGVLQTMFLAKIKSVAIVLFVVAVFSSGAGLFTHRSLTDRSVAAEPAGRVQPGRAVQDEFTALPELERGDPDKGGRGQADPTYLAGKIIGVAKDGKSITLEMPSAPRGEGPVKREIKVSDKTELTFFGVGPDGAKLAEGLAVQIWTTEAGKDVAAKMQIGRAKEGLLGMDVTGKLTAISKDGTTLTFQSKPGREDPKTIEIKLTPRTMLAYADIAKDGNKPTIGYSADVWLERGARTDAAAIRFRGGENLGRDNERGQDKARQAVSGPVVSVGTDGKSFTVAVPSSERGQAAEKLTIKIAANTRVIFDGVGPNGARRIEGHRATVTLADGSKDTAFLVTFAPPQENVRR